MDIEVKHFGNANEINVAHRKDMATDGVIVFVDSQSDWKLRRKMLSKYRPSFIHINQDDARVAPSHILQAVEYINGMGVSEITLAAFGDTATSAVAMYSALLPTQLLLLAPEASAGLDIFLPLLEQNRQIISSIAVAKTVSAASDAFSDALLLRVQQLIPDLREREFSSLSDVSKQIIRSPAYVHQLSTAER